MDAHERLDQRLYEQHLEDLEREEEEKNLPATPPAVVAFKGVTAYNVFFGVRTTSMRKESPEIDRGEVARLTGTAWKALTPDEKAPWGVKAAERNVIKRAEFDAKKAKEGANEDTDEDDE